MKVLLYLIRERGREIRVEVVTEGDPTSFVIQMQEKWRARGGIEKEGGCMVKPKTVRFGHSLKFS